MRWPMMVVQNLNGKITNKGAHMYLDPKKLIANYPSLKVRDFLKKWEKGYSWMDLKTVRKMMGIPEKSVRPFLHSLSKLGYIKRKEGREDHYLLTDNGERLSQARGTRMKRETANKIVEQLLQRINEINQIKSHKYSILTVFIFGSYIGDCPYVGDIDVSLDIWPKNEPFDPLPTSKSYKPKIIKKSHNKSEDKSKIDPWDETYRWKRVLSNLIYCHRNIEFHDFHDFFLCAKKFDLLYIDKRLDKEKVIALIKRRKKQYIKDAKLGKTIFFA